MSIRNIVVALRNDSGSPITMGSLSVGVGASVQIWDTVDYTVGTTDNFEQVLVGIATFNENIGSGNLVMTVDTVDQAVQDAFDQFGELQGAYSEGIIKDNFSVLRLEGESVIGLTGIATSTRPGLFSEDGYIKLEGIEDGAEANVVDSVFGRTGDVVAENGDYDTDQITNTSSVFGTTLTDAIEYLDGYVGSGVVNSFNGRDGVVVPEAGDYSASQITNDSTVTGTNVDDALEYLDGYISSVAGDLDNITNVGGDLSGTLPNPDVVDLTITDEEQGSILYFDGSNWVQLPPGNDGYLLQTNGTGDNPEWVSPSGLESKKVIEVGFALTEDVFNTTRYFHLARGAGGDTSDPKRSGNSSGISFQNACSPFLVPWDATVTEAILTIRGAGVQNGSVTYPVTFQSELRLQGFTADSLIGDVDFSISNSFTVGIYSVANTNATGLTTSLNLDVDKGQLIGLKFINGTGASLVGQMRNAFVTLILEER